MACNWHSTTLGNICNLIGGSAFPRRYQGQKEGIPFIKVSDMNLPANNWEITTSTNYVSDNTLLAMKAKKQPRGSVVFAKIGEALKADRTRMLTTDTAIDNNMMTAVPKPDIDKWFLYYLISWLKLSNYAEGSALPYLKQSTLSQIPVKIPSDKKTQQRVAKPLYDLDTKISLSNQINGYLAA